MAIKLDAIRLFVDYYPNRDASRRPTQAHRAVNGIISHSPLDDDWDETSLDQRCGPQAKHRPIRITAFLPEAQAKNLCNASLYADNIGCTLGTHVTAHMGMSATFPHNDPRGQIAWQGYTLDKMTKMLKRAGMSRIVFTWVIEDAPQKHRHLHLRTNVPPCLRSRLKEFIADTGSFDRARWGEKGEAIKITGHKKVTQTGSLGTLLYGLKGLRPTKLLPSADKGCFGPLDIRTEQSRPILGKRSGTSANIGRAARRRTGWVELNEWADIQAAIAPLRYGPPLAPYWERVDGLDHYYDR